MPWVTWKMWIHSAIILNRPWHNLGKNYSPSNIYNLIVKRSLFFSQNKKVQIIQRLTCIKKLNKLFWVNIVVRASTFCFINKHHWLKEKKIFYLVFIQMQMYGPRQGSRTLLWVKCQIFLEALFICNTINTNLNKNFHT